MVILNNNLIFLHSWTVGCFDYENWVDNDGDGCNGYEAWHCSSAADYVNEGEIDATTACCKCGGGKGVIFPDPIFCNLPINITAIVAIISMNINDCLRFSV